MYNALFVNMLKLQSGVASNSSAIFHAKVTEEEFCLAPSALEVEFIVILG